MCCMKIPNSCPFIIIIREIFHIRRVCTYYKLIFCSLLILGNLTHLIRFFTYFTRSFIKKLIQKHKRYFNHIMNQVNELKVCTIKVNVLSSQKRIWDQMRKNWVDNFMVFKNYTACTTMERKWNQRWLNIFAHEPE